MTDTTPHQPVECVLCAKCCAPVSATPQDLDDVLRTLEVSPTRADAPNANICRAALKSEYGPKRARQLVDLLLLDRVVLATRAYNRRHLMFLDKQQLRVRGATLNEEASQPTNC